MLLDLTTYGELSGAHILQHLPSPVQVSFAKEPYKRDDILQKKHKHTHTHTNTHTQHILQHLPSPVQVSFHVTFITIFITNSRATLTKCRPHPDHLPSPVQVSFYVTSVTNSLTNSHSPLFDLTTYMSHLSRTLS